MSKLQQELFASRYMLLIVSLLSISIGCLYTGCAAIRQQPGLLNTSVVSKTIASNGADLWDNDTQITAPTFELEAPNPQTVKLSSIFEPYYNNHNGATSLGTPLTIAFPSDDGWIQFFESGALFLPTMQKERTHDVEGPLANLIATGLQDLKSRIIRLPLLQALLTVGSKGVIGGDGSSLTYAAIRKATNANSMVLAPATPQDHAAQISAQSSGIFLKEGTRAGKNVGYMIPKPIWNYIHRTDISPDGWMSDFGAPITQALSFTITKNGSLHHMLVQAFWRDAVILDQNAENAGDQPEIQRLDTGADYLRTLGLPLVAFHTQQTVWTLGNTDLLSAPATGQVIVNVGQNFPLTLLQDTRWYAGMLWYQAQWGSPKPSGTGWVPISAITFTSPGNKPAWATINALSPSLEAYLDSLEDNVDTVVYDITHQRYYTYNVNAQFITGSSMKVAIMLTFLDMTEREGREPTEDEMELLTTMIENSNNDSASALYYNEIGGAAGVTSYLQSIGITGLNPDPDAWGYSLITPLAIVDLLTDLYDGDILTSQDRTLALYLMEHIELDQQFGVGDTAPMGATVAMKDGWLTGPDGLWAVNSSGIVTMGQETYIISVYTHGQTSLDAGQAIVRHVCGAVASLLL